MFHRADASIKENRLRGITFEDFPRQVTVGKNQFKSKCKWGHPVEPWAKFLLTSLHSTGWLHQIQHQNWRKIKPSTSSYPALLRRYFVSFHFRCFIPCNLSLPILRSVQNVGYWLPPWTPIPDCHHFLPHDPESHSAKWERDDDFSVSHAMRLPFSALFKWPSTALTNECLWYNAWSSPKNCIRQSSIALLLLSIDGLCV